MNTFWKYSLWISKFILLPPTAIFIMISVRHLAHPVAEAAQQGIAFTNPLGATIFRVGFAGFPLGCAAFFAYCLLTNRRTLTGLIFSVLLIGVVLAVRIYGTEVDSTVQQSLRLVKSEIVLVVISLVGIAIEIGRRSYARGTIPFPEEATAAYLCDARLAHLEPQVSESHAVTTA